MVIYNFRYAQGKASCVGVPYRKSWAFRDNDDDYPAGSYYAACKMCVGAYFKYGIIFIHTGVSSITLLIDFECSGIIEIMAFLSLLAFFNVYNISEKIMVGIGGFCYIMVCNALRIVLICLSVHFFGMGAYYVVHTFIGRIFFYALSVWLYFYVFTKPQIIKMKVGNFAYGSDKVNS